MLYINKSRGASSRATIQLIIALWLPNRKCIDSYRVVMLPRNPNPVKVTDTHQVVSDWSTALEPIEVYTDYCDKQKSTGTCRKTWGDLQRIILRLPALQLLIAEKALGHIWTVLSGCVDKTSFGHLKSVDTQRKGSFLRSYTYRFKPEYPPSSPLFQHSTLSSCTFQTLGIITNIYIYMF